MTLFKAYLELTKPRILMMQLVTLAMGYILASPTPFHWTRFAAAMLGTAIASGGAAALNHYWEIQEDSLMDRTKNRPLPSGLIPKIHALILGLGLTLIGVIFLAITVNHLTALLALLTSGLYVLVYTPLKKKTWLNTLVGAFPGAIPPLAGWSAATGQVGYPAWTLFLILFLWQLPHFYAIAWMYKDDYAKAGFKMLSVFDPTGWRTSREIIFNTLLLILVSTFPYFYGLVGPFYVGGAFLLGTWFLSGGLKFAKDRSHAAAKSVLRLSVIYLPILLLLILLDVLFQ
ncbi:MAG: heme o synthase [Candidatus Margulisiibacteriota bacterium]